MPSTVAPSLRRALWLAGPPLLVVAALLFLRSVWAVFALYHVGWCLLLPAAVHRGRRLSWADHAARLACGRPRLRRDLVSGGLSAAVLGGAVLLGFHWAGDALLADQRVAATLSGWRAGPERFEIVAWLMILLNAPAEELYWRGFIPTEFPPVGGRPPAMLTASAAYASYHGVTVWALLGSWQLAALAFAAIGLAGLSWAWLRERTGSVWPAVLGHVGATAAYMHVARGTLAGS